MSAEDAGGKPEGFSRHEFLSRLSAGVPTLSLAVQTSNAAGSRSEPVAAKASRKFTPFD